MTVRMWALLSLCGANVVASASPEATSRQPAEAASVRQRLLGHELSAEVGGLGVGYSHGTGRWGDGFVAAGVKARGRLGGLLLEGELFTATPTRPGGIDFSGWVTARAGWTGERWTVLAGALAQWSPGALPAVQLLPSLHARFRFSTVTLATGLFEDHGCAIAHLTLEAEGVALGYVAPLGVRAVLRLAVLRAVHFELRALALRVGKSELGLVTLAGVYGGSGSP
jgi:hypothetical protein